MEVDLYKHITKQYPHTTLIMILQYHVCLVTMVAMPTMIFTMQHPLCNIAMLLIVLILFMQSLNPTPK